MLTPQELEITEEQFSNLLKLANYLEDTANLKAKFSMDQYTDHQDDYDEDFKIKCGSVGCAIGHGPYAGIIKHEDEDWYDYSRRVFTNATSQLKEDSIFTWVFHPKWKNTDNTSIGAAKRIKWFLENNIPVYFREQLNGSLPLCYV